MSSPYLIRTRNSPLTPETKTQLFKVFEFSPMTSGKDLSSCSRNHQINSNRSISRLISDPKLRKNQVEVKSIIMSQQDLANNQPSSSSMNQSQRIREKNKPPQLVLEKPQNNASSIGIESNNIFLMLQDKKEYRKNEEGLQYSEKKSYRNHLHVNIIGVPYRKCHSSMEEKIVNVLNKLKNGKECQKQIETLLQRSKKVSTKELSNRYFVSGMYAILKLVKKLKQAHNLVAKIQETLADLKIRIIDELDSIRGFQTIIESIKKPQFNKGTLIRKAFQIFRQKRRETKKQILQKQAIKLSSWFLDQQPTDLNLFWKQLSKQ